MTKINVLQFICPTGMYGAERWILALNNNLDPTEVRSDLVVISDGGKKPEIIDHFISGENQVFEIIAKNRFNISALFSLVKLIKKRQIDIIHSHGYKSYILGVIAARITGIKVIATPHGFGIPEDLKLKFFTWLGMWALRNCDKVVPLSEQLVSEVKAEGVLDKNIKFIRNAVDLKEVNECRLSKQMKKSSDRILKIGYIGQMIPRKKIYHILDIFNQIWLENKNVVLQLLGDGCSRIEMETYAQSLPSNQSIHFLGFKNDRLEYLKEFDLFVMTSSDEGIPRCLMEAIAMEIPVAAYNIPGVDQLIIHNETGLLAEYGEQNKLKQYCLRLLKNEDIANKFVKKGSEFLNERYSGKRMASEYTALFKKLVKINE